MGGIRTLRGARRCRGELPALAIPPHEDGRALDRLQAGYGRLVRGWLPPRGARPHLLPGTARRSHPNRLNHPTKPPHEIVARFAGAPVRWAISIDPAPAARSGRLGMPAQCVEYGLVGRRPEPPVSHAHRAE